MINLDCCDTSDRTRLRAIWKRTGHAVCDRLARYAWLRSRAEAFRLAGQMTEALCMEEEMEQIYETLPSRVRW